MGKKMEMKGCDDKMKEGRREEGTGSEGQGKARRGEEGTEERADMGRN